jgi:hypothetical protein
LTVIAAVVIGHVPELRRGAGHVLATLHVAGGSHGGSCLVVAIVVANFVPNVGATNSASHGGKVLAGSAAYLMAQNTAEQSTNDRAANTRAAAHGAVVPLLRRCFRDLLLLDPAALVRRADHGMHGRHRHLIGALIRAAAPVVVGCTGQGFGHGVRAAIAVDRAYRRDAVVKAHLA